MQSLGMAGPVKYLNVNKLNDDQTDEEDPIDSEELR